MEPTTAPKNSSECYDNTKISGYKVCPRSYFIRHVLGWRSEGTANPLVFGLAWHNAMDVVWQYAKTCDRHTLVQLAHGAFTDEWAAWGFPVDMSLEANERFSPRTPGIAKEMLWGYVNDVKRTRMLDDADLLSAEQPIAVPMPGLENCWYVGRLDKAIRYAGQTLILEHKTTTAYATVGNFRSDYVDSWYASSQVKGYEFCGSMYYPSLDGVWVDAALVHKKVHDAFKFIPISHSYPLLSEWLKDTAEWITRIRNEERMFEDAGELVQGCFPKNEESCFGKYGSCPFLDICRSTADPSKLDGVPGGYVKETWEPFSILGLDKLIQQDKENTNET